MIMRYLVSFFFCVFLILDLRSNAYLSNTYSTRKMCINRNVIQKRPHKLSAIMNEGVSKTLYSELSFPTLKGIHFSDLTKEVKKLVEESGIQEGVVLVTSQHTTCAVTINEMEARLVDDSRQFLLKLVPPAYPYLHNVR